MKRISFIPALLCIVFSIKLSAQQWSAYGTGIPANTFVIGFENYKGKVYAFSQPSPYLYEYTNGNWQALPLPLPASDGVHRLRVIDTTLYALTYATGNNNHVYYLKNNTWQVLGGTFSNTGSLPSLYDILEYQNQLYVCGEFDKVDGSIIRGVTRWNGAAWEAVGQGLASGMAPYPTVMYPHQLFVYQQKLYVAGNFVKAGGITVNGLAIWNGTTWSAAGVGCNGVVYGMEQYNGDLYVGGGFTQAGGNAANNVARWNGTSWMNAGFGVSIIGMPGVISYIHSLDSIQGKLYLAGGFNRVLENGIVHSGRGIMAYDGVVTDTLLGGVNSDVEAILPLQNGILVGGDFTLAGTVACNNVALLTESADVHEKITAKPVIYPNPACSVFRIITDNVPAKCSLLNLNGQLVTESVLQDNLVVKDVPNGIYTLVIQQKNQITYYYKVLVFR